MQAFLFVVSVDTVVAVCGGCGRVAAMVLAALFALQLLRLELFLSNSQTFKHDLKLQACVDLNSQHVEN